MQNNAESFLAVTVQTFRGMKNLGERAMAQLDDHHFHIRLDPESNSLEQLILHLHGNMISRWTDWLKTDGEKPDRDRDGEFEDAGLSRAELEQRWQEGWDCLFNALASITDSDLGRIVTIRGEPHTALQAIQRQVSHYAYHVGQIVFLAKHFKSRDWKTLSIARGQSKSFRPGV